MKRLILLSLLSILSLRAMAQQADIVSVLPNQAFQNSQINIVIRGSNTHFRQGQTTVRFGTDNAIAVSNISVQDQRTLTASINISSRANTNNEYDIYVISGSEQVKATGAFTVLQVGPKMSATLNVIPVQQVAISNFDPKNIKNSPILFIVSVFNGNAKTFVTAKLTLSGAAFGTIGSATKRIAAADLKSSNPYRFTNRDFDKVDVSNASQNFMNQALQSGVLPPDDYTYRIDFYDESGNLLKDLTVDGTNTISNPNSGLQLISPGAPMTSDPETISSKYPQFQWFSPATKFDIAVYKVNKSQAQASPSDVVSQLPIFLQKGITGNTLIYPNSARILEAGVTYAWQITAHISTGTGDKTIPSEVYWFTIGQANPQFSNITRMEITPNDVEMNAGDTLRLHVTAYNSNDQVVAVKPQWRVTPPDGGTVTQDGKFTASQTPSTVAVIAQYGDIQEYSTVKINPSTGGAWDFSSFIQQVFGLPTK